MKKVTIKKLTVLFVSIFCVMLTGLVLASPKTASTSADTYFAMKDGASIRLQNTENSKYNGVTFSAIVDASSYRSENTTYKMIVMPKSYVENAEDRGYDVNDASTYCWEYNEDKTAIGSGLFYLGYDKVKVTGHPRVLYNSVSAVPLDGSLNPCDEEDAVYYKLSSSVVDMKAQNNATKYVGLCVEITSGDTVTRRFATPASEDKRYRSTLDVSIRARESGEYAAYDTLLAKYESDYITWYEGKEGAEPTFSYTIQKYYGNTLKATQTVSGQGVHATVDITPTNYTGQAVDKVYFDDEAATNCDTVENKDGKLTGYICADSEVVIRMYYQDKTQHTVSKTIYAESLGGTGTLDLSEYATKYEGTYKMLVGSSDVTADCDFDSNYTLTLSNAKEFVKSKWNVSRNIAIYAKKDYITCSDFRYITQKIDDSTELNGWGAIAKKEAEKQTPAYVGVYGHWDGYFVLGKDIFFDRDYIPWGYYDDWRYNNNGNAGTYRDPENYGFEGTFDGNNHVIDSMRMTYATYVQYDKKDIIVPKDKQDPAKSYDKEGHELSSPAAVAFITMLKRGGVIKNVAFTNGVIRSNSSFLVNIGAGTIQDVYVQIGSSGDGNPNNNDKVGIICGNYSTANLRLNRVYVATDSRKETSNAGTFTLGRVYLKSGVLNDVIVVGKINAYESFGTGSGSADKISTAQTREELKEYSLNFSGWVSASGGFWKTDADGICIPSKLYSDYLKSTTITVSLVEFENDKITVTLPQSFGKCYSSSIGWHINSTKATSGNTIVFNSKTDWQGRIGNQILSLYDLDADRIYWLDMIVATKVLKTREDLAGWTTIAKAQCSEGYLWGGTFIMANDIQYGWGNYDWTNENGGYKWLPSFATWSYMNTNFWNETQKSYMAGDQKAAGWNDTRFYGFKGVFDGNGYNIEGAETGNEVACGLVGLLHKDGVIKNVTFTHARISRCSGFLTCGAGGTIQDVYVHMDYQGGGEAANRSSIVASQTLYYTRDGVTDYNYTTKIQRVFFVVDHLGAQNLYTTPIGEFHDNCKTSHGGLTIRAVGGYGNNNSTLNSNTAYADIGIWYKGDGGYNVSGVSWIAANTTATRASMYSSQAWVGNTCVSERPCFWKKTANGDVTSLRLNGRDL